MLQFRRWAVPAHIADFLPVPSCCQWPCQLWAMCKLTEELRRSITAVVAASASTDVPDITWSVRRSGKGTVYPHSGRKAGRWQYQTIASTAPGVLPQLFPAQTRPVRSASQRQWSPAFRSLFGNPLLQGGAERLPLHGQYNYRADQADWKTGDRQLLIRSRPSTDLPADTRAVS